MRKLVIVTKNELIRYFTSPLAYVYLLSFLLLNGSFAFYFGGFFARGQASLDAMFAFQPWLYLIFVPGISMRLWAEEFRNKTIIQIVTMPVSISTLVWGKFFAAWIFCGIALLLTFPFWITVNVLGNPDNSVIVAAYFTSFLLAGSMLAISSTMSALTKNQVIALVLSFFANIIFFLSGLEFVLSLIRMFAPVSIVDMFASFSFITHFHTMTRGLFELRDIVFFASIIILFNVTTTLVVSIKTSGTSKLFKSNNKNYYVLSFILMLACFIGINLIANNSFRNVKADYTKEKLFTLSNSTTEILQNLPNNVTAKLYYSPELGQRNPDIRLMFDRIRILLDRYSVISNGKFNYKIYSPKFLDRSEDEALAAGLQAIPIIDLNQNGFFGIIFNDEIDNKNYIPFFALERQNFIEQDITQKIYQLYHPRKTVGIISSIDIGDTPKGNNIITQKWEIISQINQLYDIKFIDSNEDFKNTKFDILMIIHPQQNLSPEMVERIKEYSNSGGRFFIALDAATETSRILITDKPRFTPSDLQGLDEFWNFKFHNNLVIADLDNSITVDITQNYQTTPKFTQDVIQPRLQKDSLNKALLETANLKSILMTSISPLTPINDNNYFIPLIVASENSSLMPISVIYDNISPNRLLREFKPDKFIKVIAARIISKDPLKPYEMIVVGDTDFMYDTFWSETAYFLNNQYQIPILDNANFVMNSLDVLSGDTNLIQLRGKTAEIRKFEDIEKLRKNAQKEFSIKESEILGKIEKTKISLQEVWTKRDFEGRDTFSADELALISNIRKDLDILRQELSSIKSTSNQELEKIEAILKVLNIYTIPALIILYMIVYWFIKNHKQTSLKQKLEFNRQFYMLAFTAVVLLSLGILSVYLSDRNEIDRYENKPIFIELQNDINKVERITIKNHEATLNFINKDGLWKLEGLEDFQVYQERIRSFLSALLEATYYEKKSNKAEHLIKFGLQPIEEEGSPNTRIELYDTNNKTIISFDVGYYNVDIGRGGKAAYIKFDDKFQTWLANVDFVDLSTNWQEWTYNTIWNLRFGRIQNLNNIDDTDITTNIIKDILNIHFAKAEDSLEKTKIVTKLDLLNEDNDITKIEIINKGNDKFIKYSFPEKINNSSLAFFAKSAKDKFYIIKNEDKEKLNNVIKLSTKK